MADLSWQEIAEGIGTQTGDTLVDLANTAADFFCDVYSQFPAAIVSSPLDNPGARLVDGLARRICAPRNNLPPDAQPAPEGGQCPGIVYRVGFSIEISGTPSTGEVLLNGPIGGISSRNLNDRYQVVIECGVTELYAPEGFFTILDTGDKPTFEASYPTAQITSINREDGFADDCGTGFPNYPPSVPDSPSLGKLVPVPIGGPLVEVPIEITPVKFEVGLSIKPEFNINIGGIQFNFDITGAKITIAPTLKLPDILPPALDPRIPLPAPKEPGNDPVDSPDLQKQLDEIKKKLDEIEECACDEDEGEGALLQDIIGSGTGGTFTIPERTEFVRLELTVLPRNERVEFGNGTAQNVIFAGWYSFGTSQGDGDRNPVSYENNCFFAPKGASRFSYTVRKGASAVATAFYRAEPPEE